MKKNVIAMMAWENDKNNKTRSILIIIAIFLTTMLLTVLCTFANGLIKNNRANAGSTYGTFYGTFLSLGSDELKQMERRGEFDKIGTMANAGQLEWRTEEGKKVEASLLTADDTAVSLTNLGQTLQKGHLPEQENEIAAPAGLFKQAGYADAGIGDVVTLPYRAGLHQKYRDREFVVSGLLEEKNSVAGNRYSAYCSSLFYEAQFSGEQRRYNAYFSLEDGLSIDTDNAEDVIKELAGRCGVDEKRVSVNHAYLMWELDPGYETFMICAMIAVFVILFSVIVIYNIFQVGMAQKIQEYGKIKALGATNRQMKRLIYREGIYLALPGIPAGLIAGYLVSFAGFRWLNVQGTAAGVNMVKVSLFSPAMLLTAALLAFITVLLSLRRPMKIVASIAPVEAVRFQESAEGKKGGLRKGKKEVTVFSMAMSNITGNRRRTLTTILTMGLSCVFFVVLANWIGNIDAEYDARNYVRHGQFQISLDYSFHDQAYPENNLDSILKDNPLNWELVEKLQGLDGVTEVQTEKLLLADINGQPDSVSVLGHEDFEKKVKEGSGSGDLDYDRISEDNGIVYGWVHFLEEEGYALNQQVSMKLFNGKASTEYAGAIAGCFGSADTGWIITEDTYQKLGIEEDSLGCVWVDCREQDVPAVSRELEELLRGKDHIGMSDYQSALDLSRGASQTMKLACYLFLTIIGLIGFMNMANTMIISIITKRQEYGILQAVGMTNAQLNRSLQIQGLIFTAGTVLVALAVGLPAGYGLFVYGKKMALFGLNQYHIPVPEIVLMVLAVAVLQIVLSFLLSRNLKKESLVERIRYQG